MTLDTYFDYAAATPLSQIARAAMEPYYVEHFYNPSALYLTARAVRNNIESARAMVAIVLGARPGEIVFTAGGTESINLAIRGIMDMFPGKQVLVSAVEHAAVLEPARRYATHSVPVLPSGVIDLPALRRSITDETVLVSIMYANNEIGTIQPLREIAAMLQSVRQERSARADALPLYFHTDACQAGNYLDLQVHRLGVDLMSLNGGKIYGPKQSGLLYMRSGVKLEPLVLGGGQERGLRSGTENVPAIIGLAAALQEAAALRADENRRLTGLRNRLLADLQRRLPQLRVNGNLKHRLPNNLHITVPGSDNERVLMELDEHGFIVAAGSACSASSQEPSHVLSAIGLDETDSRSSLRLTLGRGTTQESIDRLAAAIADCTERR